MDVKGIVMIVIYSRVYNQIILLVVEMSSDKLIRCRKTLIPVLSLCKSAMFQGHPTTVFWEMIRNASLCILECFKSSINE